MTILFYIAGAIAVIASIAVILQTNIVHALLYMVVSLLSVAVVFYVLGAPFAAMLEAIVYAGAIMVLLFVIMMLNLGQHTRDEEKSWLTPGGWILPSILSAVLLFQLVNVIRELNFDILPEQVGVVQVSALLFGPYVIAVELASILLLAGLVAAYHLAKSK